MIFLVLYILLRQMSLTAFYHIKNLTENMLYKCLFIL